MALAYEEIDVCEYEEEVDSCEYGGVPIFDHYDDNDDLLVESEGILENVLSMKQVLLLH